MAYLGNPTNTIKVLDKYGFNFQKKFGQNFLIDSHVLERITDAAQITKEDLVLADTLTYICGISEYGLMTEKNGGYEEIILVEPDDE